ncbi:LLM class F420-dependent oxidoreductase [Thermomonospora curvata]|uniref:Luciferase-like monooxygenase n=1 Tax=Thermomonospora curvata (strain ATCC 19995 / DSM 43183 / JCM 3096 / KCTC 9072 / NBRC 15933 / NCIMB 10081 / Henssen B9) TaxID=471852 RepID=D1A453_THECD|nr:LLM class F420-dependent oxidoreductase [Thermomonospora curvata]ACY99927.1 Luciferase-like monooxygenase [Thermomonospora curvata DSM 43183]
MKVGISSPIVALAGNRPEWEHRAGVAELVRVAKAADRLGYDFMTCPDHVAVPPGLPRGERFYDPLATFSFLAAHTERLRFLPYVLVLPFYHPLELAKRYGTLDHLSGGRLILGLGVGNLREEFDLLGKPFDDRGPRADDALRALRAALSSRVVSYEGEYFSFKEMVIDPHAVQSRVPLWIGGHSMRALRRAVTLGDGWAPAPQTFRGPSPERMRQMLDSVQIPEGFDVVFTPNRRIDAIGRPEQVTELMRTAAEAGATRINLTVRHESLEHYLEQLEAFAEITFSG